MIGLDIIYICIYVGQIILNQNIYKIGQNIQYLKYFSFKFVYMLKFVYIFGEILQTLEELYIMAPLI